MRQHIQFLTGAGLAALALSPAVAKAQAAATSTNIGEVVVTATKTGVTNLQKTPLAVSVVDGGDLKAANVVTLKDLTSVVSGLAVDTNSQSTTIRIRGIGGGGGQGDDDVSIYMDGVYLGRNSIVVQSNFNDLERIEVVKGPQGTVFGRNSVGGAINYISKAPSDTFTFQNTLTYGNYNLIDEAFSVSGPLADKIQASLAVGYVSHAGYLDNVVPGMPDIWAANRKSIRGQLRWELSDNLVNLVRMDYLYTDETTATNQNLLVATNDPRVAASARFNAPLANSTVGDYHKIASDLTPNQTEMAYGINDELTWKINNNLSVSNLVAYRTDKSVSSHIANDGHEYYIADSGSQYRQHQFSEELNLLHNFGPLTGVAGLFFYQEYANQITNSISAGRVPLANKPGAGTYTFQDTRSPTISRAAFLSETYHITPSLGLTLGARYTEEFKRFDTYNNQQVFDPGAANHLATRPSTATTDFPFIRGFGTAVPSLTKKLAAFTPKASLDWQVTDSAMIYVSAAKGYRSGGFNRGARKDTPTGGPAQVNITPPIVAAFASEKITTYEIGAKTDLFDKRLRVNVAVFRNDWKDIQVGSLIAPQISITNNAAEARSSGVDLDIIAKPLDGLTLTASATFLPEAKYLSYTNAGPPSGIILANITSAGDPRLQNSAQFGQIYDASGKRLTSAPETSLILGAQKDFELPGGTRFYVRADYNYTSDTNYEVTNDPLATRPAFSVYNGQLGYTLAGGRWEMALWGRNLGDEQYVNYINAGSSIVGSVGIPRTFGARLNYTY